MRQFNRPSSDFRVHKANPCHKRWQSGRIHWLRRSAFSGGSAEYRPLASESGAVHGESSESIYKLTSVHS
jgi:hypothetical protein